MPFYSEQHANTAVVKGSNVMEYHVIFKRTCSNVTSNTNSVSILDVHLLEVSISINRN